jgi:murein DD-endopeptidase MepM/ murein hydrolase activator NlpD
MAPSRIWRIPLDVERRTDFGLIKWEKDAYFLSPRIGGHLHTGVDLMKYNQDAGAKVYATSAGRVVSIYAREPNKSIMIMHKLTTGESIYSVYAHITDVQVSVGDTVDSNSFIAHLMNVEQLDKYGWKFNHVHFEILKKEPRVGETGNLLSYSVLCRTKEQVDQHFYNPVSFLKEKWQIESVSKKNKQQGRR